MRHGLYHPRHHLPEIYGPYHISRMKRVKSIQAIFCLDQTYANMRSPADLQKRLASKRVYAAIWIFVLSNSDPGILILNYRTFLLVVELKSRPCEYSLADFCTSVSLTICFVRVLKRGWFLELSEMQKFKSPLENSHMV